jgi:hypothetical protein
MTDQARIISNKDRTDHGSSLLPMLVIGVVLTFAGLLATLALS